MKTHFYSLSSIRKCFLFLFVTCVTHSFSTAQETVESNPFRGFHLGITGDAQFIQNGSFGSCVNIIDKWGYGWDVGLECSYHFAKHFGISIACNYGTGWALNYQLTAPSVPDGMGGEATVAHPFPLVDRELDISIPINMEFHYPICHRLFFTSSIGVNINGFLQKAYFKVGNDYSEVHLSNISMVSNSENNMQELPFYDAHFTRTTSKIMCDLTIGMGLYYQLPYGDLLRLSTGINLSFKDRWTGQYAFPISQNTGSISLKHNYIYTQLAYILTFNYKNKNNK